MRAEHWRAITEIAACQDGLITSNQLRLAGASPTAIDQAVAEGALVRVRKGVSAVAGVPPNQRQPIRAVVLVSRGAIVSHRTAAWLHLLLDRPPRLVEISVPNAINVNLMGVAAFDGRIPSGDRTEVAGIPVTTPARTLVDLAGVLPTDWAHRLVHEAVVRRLCEYADVAAVLGRRSWQGRTGISELRDLVTHAVGSSPLEVKWHRILSEAGIPPPKRQYQVVVGGRVFLLDFAWPDHRVALETDGFAAHRTREAFDRDHDKALALRAAGWELLCVTNRTPPATAIDLLRRSLGLSTGPVPVESQGERG